jgi:hypothetical protein
MQRPGERRLSGEDDAAQRRMCMTHKPGFAPAERRAAKRGSAAAQRRKVVGKGQLAISAIGVLCLLAALWHGKVLEAGIIFVLTVTAVEIMFQRALGLFHDTAPPQLHPLARDSVQAATGAD